jgi:hypothetical protein
VILEINGTGEGGEEARAHDTKWLDNRFHRRGFTDEWKRRRG